MIENRVQQFFLFLILRQIPGRANFHKCIASKDPCKWRAQSIARAKLYEFIRVECPTAFEFVPRPSLQMRAYFTLRQRDETDRFDRTLSKTVDHVKRSVRYDQVNATLLNEFLKEHREVQELQATIAQQQKSVQSKLEAQEKQIAVLTSGLRKIDAQFELRKPEQQLAFKNQQNADLW